MTAEKPDISTQLPEIRHPALLIWGDADPISPLAAGQYLAQRLPNANLHIVTGGRHDLANSRAPELAGVIKRHLT